MYLGSRDVISRTIELVSLNPFAEMSGEIGSGPWL